MKCQHCGHDLSEHGSLGCMYEYEKPQSDGSLFCSCALTRNNAELTAAQARITALETALEAITNGYIHETASGWNVTHEFVEKSPLVKQARAALEMKL